jgi:hypothetical protein
MLRSGTDVPLSLPNYGSAFRVREGFVVANFVLSVLPTILFSYMTGLGVSTLLLAVERREQWRSVCGDTSNLTPLRPTARDNGL